jgi:hypothetical protein
MGVKYEYEHQCGPPFFEEIRFIRLFYTQFQRYLFLR